MAGITLEQAQAKLDLWLAADTAVSNGQRYEIETGNGRRQLFRADAAEIRNNITFWEQKVKALSGSRRRIRYPVRDE